MVISLSLTLPAQRYSEQLDGCEEAMQHFRETPRSFGCRITCLCQPNWASWKKERQIWIAKLEQIAVEGGNEQQISQRIGFCRGHPWWYIYIYTHFYSYRYIYIISTYIHLHMVEQTTLITYSTSPILLPTCSGRAGSRPCVHVGHPGPLGGVDASNFGWTNDPWVQVMLKNEEKRRSEQLMSTPD